MSFVLISFKSYYVVWKLKTWDWGIVASGWFKSYYVVWKPNAKKHFVKQCREFKSYYVVWKHTTIANEYKRRTGLNRTM